MSIPGQIGILNVGAGDTKLVFDASKPADMKVAAATVTDMIRRGYVILIEAGTDSKSGEPLYRRVREFRADTFEYIIAGDPVESENGHEQPSPEARATKTGKVGRPRKPDVPLKAIPAAQARGIAVGRTAGG